MAAIRLRGSTYRVEVARFGVRRSRTLPTLQAAKEWAAAIEREILAERAPHKLDVQPSIREVVEPALRGAGVLLGRSEIMAQPRLGESCGVYFLFRGDEIVYVGKSTAVHARVALHPHRHTCDSYTYVACSPELLDDLERHYIREFRPRLNQSGM